MARYSGGGGGGRWGYRGGRGGHRGGGMSSPPFLSLVPASIDSTTGSDKLAGRGGHGGHGGGANAMPINNRRW